MNTRNMFSNLDKSEALDLDPSSSVINLSIDDVSFNDYSEFFASVGYMSHQIALIEDSIRYSMIQITDDINAVKELANGKNLGALLSLYELVFLAKHGKTQELKEAFYLVKEILLKANTYRNEAVHSNWQFIETYKDSWDFSLPCYERKEKIIAVPTKLMRERALFTHKAFNFLDYLIALSTNGDGYDEDFLDEARTNLDNLKLKEFKF